MNKYLLVIVALFSVTNLFAQNHGSDTSFVINKQSYRFLTQDINADQVTLTIFRNSKIIMVETVGSDALSDLKFIDFDKDGNKDFMLTYKGDFTCNNDSPYTYDYTDFLFLFDSTNNSFRGVIGFTRFHDAIQLKTNSKYYYSCYRTGCNDMNWVSDLFYIENFSSIHVGHMYGDYNFEMQENPQEEIKVFKIIGNIVDNRKLIEKLSYSEDSEDISVLRSKSHFLKEYWNANYGKFN